MLNPTTLRPSPGALLNLSHPLSRGLVGCWLLGDGGTRAADSSSTNAHGTLINPSTNSWIGSHHGGQALSVNGSTQYILLPNSPRLDIVGNYTISAWVRPNSFSNYQNIIYKDGPSGNSGQYGFIVFADAHWEAECLVSGTPGGVSGGTLTASKWQFLTAVLNGSILTTYLNGAAVTATGSATNATNNTAATIGTDLVNSRYFNGAIDSVYMYNRPLSAAEVAQLYANTYAGFLYKKSYSFFSPSGILFDAAANSGYQAASSSYTFDRTCTGSNRFLAVDVALLSAGQTVTSVVDDFGGGANNMTLIGAKNTVSSVGRIESWGLIAPATGTKTIQVNLSGSIASSAGAVSYTGVHQTSPYESYNSDQATNVGATDATVTVTPVANNCWIHGAVATDDGSITANQTSRNNVSGAGGSLGDEDTGPISPASGTVVSYTGIGALATWAIGGYAIRPVAASVLGAVGRVFAMIFG